MEKRILRKRKEVVLILTAFILSIVCAVAAELIAYRICKDEYGFESTVFQDGSDAFDLYECEITDDNKLIVSAPVAQFAVSTFHQTFSKIRIVFREAVEQDTRLHFYYAPVGESFSEKNSVWTQINKGEKHKTIDIQRTAYDAIRFDFEHNVSFQGIYIGERDWSLLPYRLHPIRMAIVFAMIFIPVLALICLKKNKGNPSTVKNCKMSKGVLLSNLFLCLTVLFVQPLEYILVHNQNTHICFVRIWWQLLLLGIGIAFMLTMFVCLFHPKIRRVAAIISLGTGIAYLAQSLLFNEDRPLSMANNWPIEMLNIHIWFGIIIIITVMGIYYFRQGIKTIDSIVYITAWILIVIQVFNFSILATVADTSNIQNVLVSKKEVLNISLERGLPFFLKDLSFR